MVRIHPVRLMSLATKPCIICKRELEHALPGLDRDDYQPYFGGFVTFDFHYGSTKFDLSIYGTQFTGVICDDCAEKCVERMECTLK